MLWGWNQAALNPLICKILMGTLGAGLFVFAVFQQPWLPVEISVPETGVLVALPKPVRSPVPLSSSAISQAKPDVPQEEPIDVPLVNLTEEMTEAPTAAPFVQTAAITPIAKAPPTKRPPSEPTVVYQLPEAFQIPASEAELQWSFVIPTGVNRDLYLTAAELRPGNKVLVRRMILSFDPTGTARRKDQETPQPGFPSSEFVAPVPALVLGEYAPGLSARPLPKGTAYRIPAGADLILTVDYAATPVPASDPWSMGLHLTR